MGLYEANCTCCNCRPDLYGEDSDWVFYGDDLEDE